MKNSLSFQNIFKRETKLASYIIVCMTIVVISLSYAMFFKVEGNSNNQEVVAGEFKFTYSNGTTITNANNATCFLPYTADEASLVVTECSYQLNVQNTSVLKANYTLSLVAQDGNALEASKLKVILKKQDGTTMNVISGYPKTVSDLTNGVLVTESLDPNETVVYSVQLYFDDATFVDGDTSKAINYKIVGSGLVDEDNQDINTVIVPKATETITNLVTGADSSSNDVYTVPDKTSDSCTYTLAYDGTSDNNLRYVGANPCNYVTFNGEEAGWRIIGLLNTPEGQRLKLMRTNSIGSYSWDNKASGTGSSTSEFGSNDWTDSTLKEVLNNGAYYNRTSGTCPSGSNGATTSCDFTSNGLTEEARNQIDTITWKLGGIGSGGYTSSSNGLASHWYTYERGTTVYSGRPTEWQGKIGLMYPSDYGYATSGGSSMDRTSCLAKELYNWDGASDCRSNDWLYNSSTAQWTLAPYSSYSGYVFFVDTTGDVISTDAHFQGAVRPSVYLLSETSIVSGEGTPEDPYQLSVQ